MKHSHLYYPFFYYLETKEQMQRKLSAKFN